MTAWTNPTAVPGQAACPTGQAFRVQTPSSIADHDARRLAAAVGRGDEAAFRELYDGYYRRLLRFAWVLGHGDESLANDTVQAVFLTVATKLRQVESQEHLWNWLARAARQHLSKLMRQQRRHSAVVGMAEVPEEVHAPEPDLRLEQQLDAALLTMETEERQLIEWFYFEGLSHQQIAAHLNATPKAVSSRLERARARLRSLLKRTLSDET